MKPPRSLPAIIRALVFIVLLHAHSFADVPPGQKAEVEHLLDFVRDSGCVIDRNGSRHPGNEAVNHIRRKYDHFRNKIKSTEDFIDFSASRSTLSGEAYEVTCLGMRAIGTRRWLLEELESFRAGRKAKKR